jgi:hypothetical protein
VLFQHGLASLAHEGIACSRGHRERERERETEQTDRGRERIEREREREAGPVPRANHPFRI